MVFLRENPIKMDDDWGYPHFRKLAFWISRILEVSRFLSGVLGLGLKPKLDYFLISGWLMGRPAWDNAWAFFSDLWVRWPSSLFQFWWWFHDSPNQPLFGSHPPRWHMARQAHSLLRTRRPLWEMKKCPTSGSLCSLHWMVNVVVWKWCFHKWRYPRMNGL